MTRARLLLASLLALSACEPPPVVPGADKRQNQSASRIEGELVVSSAARGDVALFLFDAARPPPPQGTGRPVSFTVVPQDVVFGAAADGDQGPFTAPFAFSLVAPGRYLVRGFVDANRDFIPWYAVTSEANLGDVGGAAVDAVTRASREVVVDETLTPALDVPVSFSDAARTGVDRPAFSVVGGAASLTVTPGGPPAVLELAVHPLDEGLVHQRQPAFLARLLDDDQDGVPDDRNGDGVPEMWPRVVVRKLADGTANPLLDENDLDRNGLLDEGGADYAHLDPSTGQVVPPDGSPDLVVLAAAIDPTDLLPQLLDGTGRPRATPTPVSRLKVVVRALALDASNPADPRPLKVVPPGRYAVVLINPTGQTWRVPNELMPGFAEGVGLPTDATQAFVVQVP